MEEIERWLHDFILLFRAASAELTDEQKNKIKNLYDFSAPCQLLLLWFPQSNLQYLFCKHDKDYPDLKIRVEGPIQLYQALDKMDAILKEPEWTKKVSDEESTSHYVSVPFTGILESCFVEIFKEIKYFAIEEPSKTGSIGFQQALAWKYFQWTIFGNIADLDKSVIIRKAIDSAKNEHVKKSRQQTTNTPDNQDILGYSTYFYPPISIGKLEEKTTFREKALGITPLDVALNLEYKKRSLVIYKDGLIAIAEPNIQEAARLLNEIMAGASFYGINANTLRDAELSDAHFDSSSKTLLSWGITGNTPRTQMQFPFSNEYVQSTTNIEKDLMRKIIAFAERNCASKELSDLLILFLEATTHFRNFEYTQSFIMSWSLIEINLFWNWNNFLKNKALSNARITKLKNSGQWSADYVIECLNLSGYLNDCEELLHLKSHRNKIVHSARSVTKDEASECLKFATKIVKQRTCLPCGI